MARYRIARRDEVTDPSIAKRSARPWVPAEPSIATTGHGAIADLLRFDAQSRTRQVQRLQQEAGNRAVGSVLGLQSSDRTARGTVQREAGTEDGAVALDTPVTPGGASETIGPETSSDYQVNASTLADVVQVIGGRDEAGHVGWVENMSSSANTGPTVDTVTVTVSIDLEMPSWAPPSSMLPKARAEWNRWYAALLAHEQGHIRLVHDVHDGIASRLLGKTPRQATATFDAAKASLQSKSDAYDVRTGHGLRTGTVLDVGVETRELDEEQRKRDAAEQARHRDGAVPDDIGRE